MVTTKQKPITDVQKTKRKKSKHAPTENHQKKSDKEQNSQKAINNMAMVSSCQSINTLNEID